MNYCGNNPPAVFEHLENIVRDTGGSGGGRRRSLGYTFKYKQNKYYNVQYADIRQQR